MARAERPGRRHRNEPFHLRSKHVAWRGPRASPRVRLATRTTAKPAFLRAWCAVAYASPGLHPDGFEDEGSVCPRALRRFPAEAWQRAGSGELSDEQLYPGDAQRAGLYDRILERDEAEAERRFQIAADHGALTDG